MAGVGRLGRLLRRRAWRHDQRPARATAAGLGAQAVYLCAGVRGGLEPGHACWPTCRRTSRRPSRASSTARATTTDGIAGRCSRARARRIRKRAGGRAGGRDRRAEARAIPSQRGVDVVRQDRLPLRPRHHARERRSAARRAGRRVCGVRARRRCCFSRRLFAGGDRDGRDDSFRRGRRSGSPTSSRTPMRASTFSAVAAASSFRFRSRRKPARRRAITTTGRSAIRAMSPLASGSAISIARRCELVRRHRRGPDFSRRDARCTQACRGTGGGIDEPLAMPPSTMTRASICALSGMRARDPARRASTNGCRPVPPIFRAAGITCAKTASSWSGRRSTGSGRRRKESPSRSSIVHRPSSIVSTIDDRRWTIDDRRMPPVHPESARGSDLSDRSDAAIEISDNCVSRVGRSRCGPIEWTVDGKPVGVSGPDAPFHWPLSPGTHRIVAADDRGRNAETTILVKSDPEKWCCIKLYQRHSPLGGPTYTAVTTSVKLISSPFVLGQRRFFFFQEHG